MLGYNLIQSNQDNICKKKNGLESIIPTENFKGKFLDINIFMEGNYTLES